MSASAAPVRGEDLVSDVLSRDEALVEVFARRSPHFARLRSRALRRVMARLVTVAQAARIAGVPSEELLRELNRALGFREDASIAPGARPAACVPAAGQAAAAPAERARPSGATEVELDVRHALRAGEEPFSRIMSAIAALRDGEVLHLRTTFEPVPLFGVLAKRGFAHDAEASAPDDWNVWFWRPSRHDVPAGARARERARHTTSALCTHASELQAEYVARAAEQLLDVRGLEPPEPMLRTLAALEELPADMVLVQINQRLPQFLFPILAQRGFACLVDDSQPERVLVRIWRSA